MRRNLCGGILAFALLAGLAETSVAQQTLTPIFKAPFRAFNSHEFGASVSDPEGFGVAVEGFYRYGSGPYDLSARVGFADATGPGSAILLGGDFRTQVVRYSESFPLDGALTLGLGGILGADVDDTFFLPIGISLGRTFNLEGSNTVFVPYVHPVLGPTFGSNDNDVLFALGLGVDIKFSESWAVRASGGLGDIEGVGISLAYLR
ncbi:MAG: hypothetical protein M3Q93_12270 [Gemmatimonadota bacterium]|nr:hypothetical protein [Gemmatimonadota bacterium]